MACCQVSSPRGLRLDIDSDDDWSISMATPTCQRLPVGLTPVIATTDEETPGRESQHIFLLYNVPLNLADPERSVGSAVGGPVTCELAGKV